MSHDQKSCLDVFSCHSLCFNKQFRKKQSNFCQNISEFLQKLTVKTSIFTQKQHKNSENNINKTLFFQKMPSLKWPDTFETKITVQFEFEGQYIWLKTIYFQ